VLKSAAFLAAILTACVAAEPALARTDVVDHSEVAVKGGNGEPLDLAGTRAAILHGAKASGWRVHLDEPGKARLYFSRRDDMWVAVDVSYRAGSFDLRYAESSGLNYLQRKEHRRISPLYDRWITALIAAITGAPLSSAFDPNAAPPPVRQSAAPEKARGVSLDDLPLPGAK
jgi:hypothetical protein